jgi:hypothetical protein
VLVGRAAPSADRVHVQEPIGERLVAGFRAIGSQPGLRLVFARIGLQTFVAGALAVVSVLVAIRLLGLGSAGVGYLNSAVGIGGLLGSLLAAGLVGRVRLAPPFILGIFVWSVPLVLVGVLPHAAVALAVWGVIGVANMLSDVAGFTLIQRTTPDPVLARVFGVLEMTMYTAMALGSVTAPALVDLLGTRGSLVALGLLLPVCVLVSGTRVLALDRTATVPGETLRLVRAIPMFAALPATTLERLARDLEPFELDQGAAVFRQGDHGDRFYVVTEGELDVLVDDRPVRHLEAGDYFGEIALLRDLPRTATVLARTPAKLAALARDEFVAAVTGNHASAHEAELIISDRLGVASVG